MADGPPHTPGKDDQSTTLRRVGKGYVNGGATVKAVGTCVINMEAFWMAADGCVVVSRPTRRVDLHRPAPRYP